MKNLISIMVLSCTWAVYAADPLISLPFQGSILDAAGSNPVSYVGAGAPVFVPGFVGTYDDHRALDCDGSGSVEVDVSATTGAISLSMWVKLDDFHKRNKVVLLDTGSQQGGVQLSFYSVNMDNTAEGYYYIDSVANKSWIEFRVVGNNGGNGSSSDTVRSLFHRVNEYNAKYFETKTHWASIREQMLWLHIGIVYDPTTKKVDFYKNERWDSAQTFSTAVPATLDKVKVAPHQNISESLDGKVCQLNIFDKAIERSQIEELGDFEQQIWALKDMNSWKEPSVTYYVSPTGSDGGDGSAGAPVKTIKKGLSLLTGPGQRLVLKDGVYRITDSVAAKSDGSDLKNYTPTLNASGTRFEPVIIEAENPGNVTLMGSEDWTGKSWTKSGTDTYYTAWPYDFSGYSDYNQNVAYRPEGVFQDGKVLYPVTFVPTNDATFFVDNNNKRLYIRTKTPPANSSTLEVVVNRSPLIYVADQDYVVIRGINFKHSSAYEMNSFMPECYGALDIRGAHGLLIEDCSFIQNVTMGLFFGEHNSGNYDGQAVIRRCLSYNNGYGPSSFSPGVMNVLVEDFKTKNEAWRYKKLFEKHPVDNDVATMGKFMGTANIRYRRFESVDNNDPRVFWSDGMNVGHSLLDSYIGSVNGTVGDSGILAHGWFDEINGHNVWWRGNSLYKIKNSYSNDGEGALIEDSLFWTDVSYHMVQFRAAGGVRYRRVESSPFAKGENRLLNNTFYNGHSWGPAISVFDSQGCWGDSYIAAGNTYAKVGGYRTKSFYSQATSYGVTSKRTVGGKTELSINAFGPDIRPGYLITAGGVTFTVESVNFQTKAPVNPNTGVPYNFAPGTVLLDKEDTGNKIGNNVVVKAHALGNASVDYDDWFQYFAYNETGATFVGSDPFVNDGSVTVSFETNELWVSEQNAPIVIPVNLSKGVTDTLTAEIEVIQGSATEGDDFRVVAFGAENNVWTWQPLQRYQAASLIIYPDQIAESDETFTLRLKNPSKCSLGAYSQLTVHIDGGEPPVADITSSSDVGLAPFQVTFDGSGSSDVDGTIASYSWDFNFDGIEDATGVTGQHTYQPGTHTAALTVTDNDGLTSTARYTITVLDPADMEPIVWYKLNETSGTTVTDSSGNNYTGTASSAGFVSSGKYNGAFQFSGSNKITMPHSVFDQINDEITITMWTKDPDSSVTRQVLFYGGGGAYQFGLFGIFSVKFGGQDLNTSSESEFANGGQWAHWAFICDSRSISLYKDGVLLGTRSVNLSLSKPTSLTLGARSDGSSAFSGFMDDVRIYNKALSVDELSFVIAEESTAPVASCHATPTSGTAPLTVVFDGSGSSDADGTIQSYEWDFDSDGTTDATGVMATNVYQQGNHTATLTVTDNDALSHTASAVITVTGSGGPSSPTPLVWYKLDETSGTSVADASGNGYHGTAAVAPSWQPTGGKYDGAYQSTDQNYITVPASAFTQLSTAATISFWMKGSSDMGNIFFGTTSGDYNSGGSMRALAGRAGTGGYSFDAGHSGSAYSYRNLQATTPEPNVNAWEHWTLTTDSAANEMILYRNGAELARRTQDRDVAGITYFIIGQGNYGRFKGALDDFRIYAKALSPSEITTVMNNSTGPVIDTTTDSDSDGVTDFLEDAFGTDPNTPDRPALSSIFQPQLNGNVDYQVRNMTAGYTYDLQTSTNLVSGSWQTVTNFVGSGGPSTVTIDKSKASPDGKLFIRIRVSK